MKASPGTMKDLYDKSGTGKATTVLGKQMAVSREATAGPGKAATVPEKATAGPRMSKDKSTTPSVGKSKRQSGS